MTRFTYDALGRLLQTTYADGANESQAYDAAGRTVTTTDARGEVTRFTYDAGGRQTAVTDALNQTTTVSYDGVGNVLTRTDPQGRVQTYTYDAAHRVTRSVFPGGTEHHIAYDVAGRKVSDTNEAGHTTRWGYAADGQLTSVTDALGQTTRYTFDEAGNQLTRTDANGHTTRFVYDKLGRRSQRILPGGAVETLTYDGVGNRVSRTDFAGRTTTYAYDTANRLVRRTYSDSSTVAFTYTGAGQRATASDARGTTTYTYDGRGRLQAHSSPGGGRLAYTYDAQGNRSSMTATLGTSTRTTTYAYDELNRLQTVTDPQGRRYTYTYDPNGNRASMTQPNGVTTIYTYNARNRLTTLTSQHGPTTQVVQQYDLTLGPAGNRTRISEHGGTVRDYTYDTLLRLTGEQVTRNGTLADATTYTYDPVGNRTTQTTTGTNTGTVNYTYDERDRLLTEDTTAYTWDANGNLVSRAGDATYVWDFENRLTRVELAGGGRVAYVYDVAGNRVQTTVTPATGTPVVTHYLVDSTDALSQVVAESDGAGALGAYYVRGDGELLAVVRATHTRFYHADATGSTRALTDEAGSVTDTYTYSAFGELLAHVGSDPQPYAFAGEPRDPNSGFAYHRARWMDPQVGRFVSSDPFAGNTSDPVSLHKYLYANADPVNRIDPSGYISISEQQISSAIRNTLTVIARVEKIFRIKDEISSIVDILAAIKDVGRLLVAGGGGSEVFDLANQIESAAYGNFGKDAMKFPLGIVESLHNNAARIAKANLLSPGKVTKIARAYAARDSAIILYLPGIVTHGSLKLRGGFEKCKLKRR